MPPDLDIRCQAVGANSAFARRKNINPVGAIHELPVKSAQYKILSF